MKRLATAFVALAVLAAPGGWGSQLNWQMVDVNDTEGTSFTRQIAKFTDPSGGGSVGDYKAEIDWGDGEPRSDGEILEEIDGGFSSQPEAAEELRQTHFRLLRGAVAASGGTEVKNLGDGLMVVFPTASAALACAVGMQQATELDNRDRDLWRLRHSRAGRGRSCLPRCRHRAPLPALQQRARQDRQEMRAARLLGELGG